MLEDYLIKYCSPALSNLKAGSLFAYPAVMQEDVLQDVRRLNLELSGTGVTVDILKFGQKSVLFYVYREKLLEAYLQKSSAAGFLEDSGYPAGTVYEYIDLLKKRLKENGSFPHEIGIFLGYPTADVAAFIKNRGQNCRLTRYWKVYDNEEEASKVFAQYDACTARALKLFQAGHSVRQIAVST